MPHRNAIHLDAAHNSAIRKEIGHRLRAQLSREHTSPPPQHLLDSLSLLDAIKGRTQSSDDDTSH
jgi:hypothetical protein